MLAKSEDNSKLLLECDCGCGKGVKMTLEQDEEYDVAFMDFYSSNFYTDQEKPYRRKLHRLWQVLRGKDYVLNEMVFNGKDDLVDFATSIAHSMEVAPSEYRKDGWYVCPRCESEQYANFLNDNYFCSNCGVGIKNIWSK